MGEQEADFFPTVEKDDMGARYGCSCFGRETSCKSALDMLSRNLQRYIRKETSLLGKIHQ